MPLKSVKMKISKNKKMRFFLMFQGSLNPKIRYLGQKVCPVARWQTHRHTWKWLLCAPFQGFRSFSFNLSSRIGPIQIEAAKWSRPVACRGRWRRAAVSLQGGRDNHQFWSPFQSMSPNHFTPSKTHRIIKIYFLFPSVVLLCDKVGYFLMAY